LDLAVLAGLTKRQVRAIAAHLGAPQRLVVKTPTADLEDDRPGLPDEQAYGCTYDEIDDYLQLRPVPPEVRERIERAYDCTAHKRRLPAAPCR
jgi:NAD+ synthase